MQSATLRGDEKNITNGGDSSLVGRAPASPYQSDTKKQVFNEQIMKRRVPVTISTVCSVV
jgi:hypothetical protein